MSTAQEAIRLAEQTERPANAAAARVYEGKLAACRGDVGRADELADEVERSFRPLGAVPVLDLVAALRGLSALAAGDPERAYAHVSICFTEDRLGSALPGNSSAISIYADAAAQGGFREEAASVLAHIDDVARQCGSPAIHAATVYMRAVIAPDDQAEAEYAAAFAADLSRWPFMEARLHLAYGTWLRSQRRINDSRVPLRVARDLFDALGALPWGERARQQLRATGEASAERQAGALDQLTPQELEIATLAAAGLTNRQIGQRLYLSHRTIGSHLYHLFPKLGVTSRTELAAVLGGGNESHD